MSNNTLVIANVSLTLLERQRLSLVTALSVLESTTISEKVLDDLDGILNMLDTWSDLEKEVKKCKQ